MIITLSVALARLCLELLLTVANIDTPIEPAIMIDTYHQQYNEAS